MGVETNYDVRGGQVTGNLSSTTNIIAGVTGRTMSLKRVAINMSAAGNMIIEQQTSGTDMIGPIYLGANGGAVLEFSPGTFLTASGVGVNALSSVTGSATVVVEVYVHSAT